MKTFTTILLATAATLAAAAPTNHAAQYLFARSNPFSASINFYTRWDCHNACVEDGYCLSGQSTKGIASSWAEWIGYPGTGCFDRPAGVHSLGLSTSNGHKFVGIGKSCEAWVKSGFQAETFELETGAKFGHDACNVLPGEKMEAVVYQW